MEKLIICGGRPLSGTVDIHGAKNSALPILAACVLCPERCVITRCPAISDVNTAVEILTYLGCSAERMGTSVVVDASEANKTDVPQQLMEKMRASVNFLGALLGRFGACDLSLPGGCSLGERPIDYHIAALSVLGVTMEEDGGRLKFRWKKRRGGEITLPFPSVGATENVVMAALCVPEPVVLRGAAREPEVEDLCRFLGTLGADIGGIGSDTLTIRGGKPLHGGVYTVMPDRMEAATYLALGAACGGTIKLRGAEAEHLVPVTEVLRRAGCRIESEGKMICLSRNGPLCGAGYVETAAYPGFPTDAQAPVMAAMLRAEGETVFHETVFKSRFRHVHELRKFGAEIITNGSTAAVRGIKTLHGAAAAATDLRGGAAVLLAALQADGESSVEKLHFVERGYAELTENLRNLGAVLYEQTP